MVSLLPQIVETIREIQRYSRQPASDPSFFGGWTAVVASTAYQCHESTAWLDKWLSRWCLSPAAPPVRSIRWAFTTR